MDSVISPTPNGLDAQLRSVGEFIGVSLDLHSNVPDKFESGHRIVRNNGADFVITKEALMY